MNSPGYKRDNLEAQPTPEQCSENRPYTSGYSESQSYVTQLLEVD